MTIDNSIPQIHGKDLEVAEIDGPCGRFKVASAGSRLEGGMGFFYQDERARFFFYGEFYNKPAARWDFTRATTGPFGGVAFKTTSQNEDCFRQNIEFFLKTRHWFHPSRPGDASTVGTAVTFSWRIVR